MEHLSKRVLKDVAEGKIAEYLEIENLNPFNKALCPWIGNTRPTFCIQQRFSDATSEDLDSDGHWVAATRPIALSGCTVLVLVSTRAVYAVSLPIYHPLISALGLISPVPHMGGRSLPPNASRRTTRLVYGSLFRRV